MNTALITGASSGIGKDLAYIHASKKGDLILIARNKTALQEIKSDLENKYGVKVLTIAKDLSLTDSANEVFQEVVQQNIEVDYLINNAGFGDYGFFYETDWQKELQMINLNITTLTHLTKLFLLPMIKRGRGKILNLASTAAFQPGPKMAIYFATKAFVLHFSEAVNNEVKDKGVSVTALCPGATATGFKDAANLGKSRLFNNHSVGSSQTVAVYGYNSMIKGKPVAIPGVKNQILAFSSRLAPRNLVTKISRVFIG